MTVPPDRPHPPASRRGRAERFLAALAIGSALAAAPLGAQMPGLPVLQNGFTGGGVTAAIDYGHGKDGEGYGLAGGFGVGSRLQLSAGLGAFDPAQGATRTAYGARLALPVLRGAASGRLGIAAFAGVGGTARKDSVALLAVPVGAAVAFRGALGATRAWAVYAAPFYSWWRAATTGAATRSTGLFRASVGFDVTLTPKIGATLGIETGAAAKEGDPGPRGTSFGIGLSYAFRRGS